MGARGPAPKPTQLKVVRGTRKDRVNTAEPLPDVDGVVPPDWLPEVAVAVWDRYAPDLVRKKVLTRWDVEDFALWCSSRCRMVEAQQHLDRDGVVVEQPVFDRNGKATGVRMLRSEWWAVWKDASEVMLRRGARFGMNPSDRASLKVSDGQAKNQGEDLLTG